MKWLCSNIYTKHDGCNCNRLFTQTSRFKMFMHFYLKTSSAVAMGVPQKSKLPILNECVLQL